MHYYWDNDDPILKAWVQGIGAEYLPYEEIIKTPVTNPISFRSLAKRKVIYESLGNKRPFYYIDTGYVGNLIKKKMLSVFFKKSTFFHIFLYIVPFRRRLKGPLGASIS